MRMLRIMVYDQSRLQVPIKTLYLRCLGIIKGGGNMPNSAQKGQVVERSRFEYGCIVGNKTEELHKMKKISPPGSSSPHLMKSPDGIQRDEFRKTV
jgi:hypothetical protein